MVDAEVRSLMTGSGEAKAEELSRKLGEVFREMDEDGDLSSKMMESLAAQGEVTRVTAEFLTTLFAGEVIILRQKLCNDAFREVTTAEQLEKLSALFKEKLGRPGEPTLSFYKTDVMGEGILALGRFDVSFANGKGTVQIRMRKTDAEWLVEGFNIRSPLFEE